MSDEKIIAKAARRYVEAVRMFRIFKHTVGGGQTELEVQHALDALERAIDMTPPVEHTAWTRILKDKPSV